jgi:hypothetical protein
MCYNIPFQNDILYKSEDAAPTSFITPNEIEENSKSDNINITF